MLVLAVYAAAFGVGLPANVFALAVLLCKARRRLSPAEILLLNLTAADLLLLLFLPFKMAEAAAGMTWPLPAALCPVANFCFFSSIYLSSLFLAALSVERYLGVAFPLQYKLRRRPRLYVALSGLLWLLACAHCSVVFVAAFHGAADGSAGGSSNPVGSVASEAKSSNPDVFTANRARRSNPNVLMANRPKVSNPNMFMANGARSSNPKMFMANRAKSSNPNMFMANGAKISNSNMFMANGAKISNPNMLMANGAKSSNPNMFVANGAKISNPNMFMANGAKSTNPAGFMANGAKISNPNMFMANGAKSTNPNMFVANRAKISNSNMFMANRAKISNPNMFMANGAKSSNPAGFMANGAKSSNPNVFMANGAKISNPQMFVANGAKISNPNMFMANGAKSSNPNVFTANRAKSSNPAGFTANGAKSSNPSVFMANRAKSCNPNVFTANGSETSNPHLAVPGSSASKAATADGATTPTCSSSPEAFRCYDDFSKMQLSFVLPLRLELFLVLFLLPFAVTVFCYVNFVRVLLARPNIPLEKKQRAVGLAVATMVNFGICFAPYNLSHVVGFVQHQSPGWRHYALIFTSLNAALDPVIFYFSSTAVQRAVAGVAEVLRGRVRAAVSRCCGSQPAEATAEEEVEEVEESST
ncbi:uncharacterized protein LOC134154200 [Rhea pennata]|uniref:uncharacterized protein LOC134154200 n=1 Tax=Rhea pennata TaxID=8795 RepID=UPI002E26BB28